MNDHETELKVEPKAAKNTPDQAGQLTADIICRAVFSTSLIQILPTTSLKI